MQRVDFLPIGSVVLIRNGIKKVMITARGIGTSINGEIKMFDYGGCMYPEGVVDEKLIYFNHEDIEKVYHKGYTDEDDTRIINAINEFIEKSEFQKGSPYELNIQNIKRGK